MYMISCLPNRDSKRGVVYFGSTHLNTHFHSPLRHEDTHIKPFSVTSPGTHVSMLLVYQHAGVKNVIFGCNMCTRLSVWDLKNDWHV